MVIKKTLKNGLRVVCEHIPYVKSMSVGVWAGVGSRFETKDKNGISHYAEHMLFKGTKKRSATDISAEMDFIGGNLNAFTSREYTCYYAKVIDRYLEKAMDILSDMYINAALSQKDVDLERNVILEEINMYEDSPEDIALDLLSEAAWGDMGLGCPICGTAETINLITRLDLLGFREKYYTAENTVLSVAGSFDEETLFSLAEKYFGGLPSGQKTQADLGKPYFTGIAKSREKEIEQSHLAIGYMGAETGSPKLYPEAVLSNILGGGMSSRLFTKIREERGLAYSVYSAPEAYSNTGMLYIYAAMSHENAPVVREIIDTEIDDIIKNGITEFELEKGREQLRGSYILGLESVSGRMSTLGKNEILGEEHKTPDEIISSIDAVDMASIESSIKDIFCGKRAQAFVTCRGKRL
jgi:predicted Zn-dependent peptidase